MENSKSLINVSISLLLGVILLIFCAAGVLCAGCGGEDVMELPDAAPSTDFKTAYVGTWDLKEKSTYHYTCDSGAEGTNTVVPGSASAMTISAMTTTEINVTQQGCTLPYVQASDDGIIYAELNKSCEYSPGSEVKIKVTSDGESTLTRSADTLIWYANLQYDFLYANGTSDSCHVTFTQIFVRK